MANTIINIVSVIEMIILAYIAFFDLPKQLSNK